MRECLRILKRKKYILCFAGVIAASILLFQYFQTETLGILHDPETGKILEQEWKEKQENAGKEFEARTGAIDETVKSLSRISIFSDENSFSYKNMMRTQKDFARVKHVRTERIRDHAVEAFMEYGEIHFFAFFFLVFTILSFLEERKSGFWQIVYSCSGGRVKLGLRRTGILAGICVLTETVLNAGTLLASFYDYGGGSVLSAPVQSVSVLQNITVPWSTLTFLVYYTLVHSAGLFVNGLFVWLIFSVVHNRNLAMVLTAAVYGCEYVLNRVISPLNPVCMLKYLNLCFFLDPGDAFLDYVNFPAGNILVNLGEFLVGSLLVLTVVFGAAVLCASSCVRPFYVTGFLERLLERFFDACRRRLCGLGAMGSEWYKMLVQGKGLLVLLVFWYIVVASAWSQELVLSPGRELLNDFYDGYTGNIHGAAGERFDAIRAELEAVEKESGDEVKYSSYEAERNMFSRLEEQKKYAERLEKRGIDGWFLNVRGFEMLLGEGYSVRRLTDGVLAVLVIFLILAGVYAQEWQSGMANVVRCTVKGRGTVYRRKLACGLSVALLAAVTVCAKELYEVAVTYPLHGMLAPVQNIVSLERFPFRWNIITFLIVWFLMRIFVMCVAAVLCLCISVLAERVERAYVYSVPVLGLALLSGVSEYLITGTDRIRNTVTVMVVLCGMAVAATIVSYKKWTEV